MTARMADEPVLVKIFSFLKDVRSRLACTALTESVVQLKNTHIFPGKKRSCAIFEYMKPSFSIFRVGLMPTSSACLTWSGQRTKWHSK